MAPEKVSIIIPVYNVEPYLAQCLESAVRQDYDNLEIIAIDDGSTDASPAILEHFRARHERIVVKNIRNQGLSVARNTGLEIATGDYILFLDSDDFLERHTVSTCVKHLGSREIDMVFFAGNIFFDGIDESLSKKFLCERALDLQNKRLPADTFFSESIRLRNYLASACLYAYRRNSFDNIRFHPGILHEDNLFTTRMLLENKTITAKCIPDRLYNRRVRPDSIMTQDKQEKHVTGYLVVAEELLKLQAAKEDSEPGAALNKFIRNMLINAALSCREACQDRLPYSVRKRSCFCSRERNPGQEK
ncbi:glycosyltransferase family 2 protein [Azorhizophilus paspali]|uniref:glycosyltransferase family 2 protein n=1 Tax=Azorhizophilus paspali TaxID=69963 RepID=UPI003645E1F2